MFPPPLKKTSFPCTLSQDFRIFLPKKLIIIKSKSKYKL